MHDYHSLAQAGSHDCLASILAANEGEEYFPLVIEEVFEVFLVCFTDSCEFDRV